jgi:hypothetical protein
MSHIYFAAHTGTTKKAAAARRRGCGCREESSGGNALGAVAGKGNCPTLTARFLLCWNRVLVLEKRENSGMGDPPEAFPLNFSTDSSKLTHFTPLLQECGLK